MKGVDVGTCREETPIARQHDGLRIGMLEPIVNGLGNPWQERHGERLCRGLTGHFDETDVVALLDLDRHLVTSQFHVDVLDLRVEPKRILTLLNTDA